MIGGHDRCAPGRWTVTGPGGAGCWIADDGDCGWCDARGVPGSGVALARYMVEVVAEGELSEAGE